MSQKCMSKSFDLTWKKGYCANMFNTAYILYYVVPYPEPKNRGAD